MLLAGGPAAAQSAVSAERLATGTDGRLITTEHRTLAGGWAALALLTGPQRATYSDSLSSSPHPCRDGAWNVFGPRWKSTLRWSFNAGTTPSSLGKSAALTVIKRGLKNIVSARNDCGRPDRVGATTSYLGTTRAAVSINKYGRCTRADGRNVVAFGSLPSGVLGVACIRSSGGRIVEADIRLTNRVRWAMSTSSCWNRYMLEAVMTHEAGHAFGLAHVSERYHARLTMSSRINGACQNSESTLGLGDLKALEALY